MSNFANRNMKVFTEVEAMLEKVEFGSMDYSLEIHNKRITHLTMYGKKRNVYRKTQQDQAYRDIVARVKQAIDGGEETKLTFVVEIDKGNINEIIWLSKFRRNYEELDKKLDK